jgi:hypothetical protein
MITVFSSIIVSFPLYCLGLHKNITNFYFFSGTLYWSDFKRLTAVIDVNIGRFLCLAYTVISERTQYVRKYSKDGKQAQPEASRANKTKETNHQ